MHEVLMLMAPGVALLGPAVATAAQAVPDQLSQWLGTLVQLVTLALPLIGITGGIQGLLGGMPDVTIWRWTIKGGVVVVAGVAALGWVAANLLGWVQPPSAYPTPEAWAAAQYAGIVATMTLLYKMGGFGVKPPPDPLVALGDKLAGK